MSDSELIMYYEDLILEYNKAIEDIKQKLSALKVKTTFVPTSNDNEGYFFNNPNRFTF